MGYSRYQVNLLVRLVLIVGNCYAIAYVAQLNERYWTLGNLIVLLLFQCFLLFRFHTFWQREIQLFAQSVKHGDYSISYQNKLLKRSDPRYTLYEMMNNVSKYVRELKASSEENSQYFKYVVENAQVGLLACSPDWEILLVNKEALRLTGQQQLRHLSDIRYSDAALYDALTRLELNQSKLIVSGSNRNLKLSARLSTFVIGETPVHLFSLVNIRPELEENELQSWQALISVLTHEIMNSITPIHSLNGAMAKYLGRIEGNEEIVAKVKNNLEVINRRSESLMGFVDRYRQISTVPLPRKEDLQLRSIIREVIALLEHELKDVLVVVHENGERIVADRGQITQVMINILKNAVSAMKNISEKRITISISRQQQGVLISVTDSGHGLQENIDEKVFIPFFTTREGGSGVGLTISRQIMQRHGGNISIANARNGGAVVTLLFPE